MNYTKLASEARKLYTALRDEEFDVESACEIVKVCVRDYPIFREMIEEEELTPDQALGYLYFVDGHKEPIYRFLRVTDNTIEVHTKDCAYRETIYVEQYPFSFNIDFNSRTVKEYLTFFNNDWKTIYSIDHIELF